MGWPVWCLCSYLETLKDTKGSFGEMPVGSPLDHMATDILGPLPITPQGNHYIFGVTDHFSKWVEIFPVVNYKAETCTYLLVEEVFMRYGFPLSLHSDQGTNYESHLMAEMCKLLEIRKTHTSPGNPWCNGQMEHSNWTLMRMVKVSLKEEQTNWDRHLGVVWLVPTRPLFMRVLD